jgi:hypothetical protein
MTELFLPPDREPQDKDLQALLQSTQPPMEVVVELELLLSVQMVALVYQYQSPAQQFFTLGVAVDLLMDRAAKVVALMALFKTLRKLKTG